MEKTINLSPQIKREFLTKNKNTAAVLLTANLNSPAELSRQKFSEENRQTQTALSNPNLNLQKKEIRTDHLNLSQVRKYFEDFSAKDSASFSLNDANQLDIQVAPDKHLNQISNTPSNEKNAILSSLKALEVFSKEPTVRFTPEDYLKLYDAIKTSLNDIGRYGDHEDLDQFYNTVASIKNFQPESKQASSTAINKNNANETDAKSLNLKQFQQQILKNAQQRSLEYLQILHNIQQENNIDTHQTPTNANQAKVYLQNLNKTLDQHFQKL
jgi:hypothetical protein